MVEFDRVFLILLAIILYAHGVPKLIVGAIIVSLLGLEYMFYLEHQHVQEHYFYPPRETQITS